MELLEALGVMRERINRELQQELKKNGIGINRGHILLLSLVYQKMVNNV